MYKIRTALAIFSVAAILLFFQNCIELQQRKNDEISFKANNNGSIYAGFTVEGAQFAEPGATVTYRLSGGNPPYSAQILRGDGSFKQIDQSTLEYKVPTDSTVLTHQLQFSDSAHLRIDRELRIEKILSFDFIVDDLFGKSVSVSGNRVAIGSPSSDIAEGFNSGAVYIYERTESSWAPQQKIFVANSRASFFGSSLHLNDSQLIVGSPLWDGETGCCITQRKLQIGRVHIFERNDNQYLLKSVLEPKDLAVGDHFGTSVLITPQFAFIGASSSTSGSVYVYRKVHGEWQPLQKISPLTTSYGFGRHLAYENGNLILSSESFTAKGQLFLYQLQANGDFDLADTKVQINPGGFSDFGESYSLVANNVFVSEYKTADSTYLHVFEISRGKLVLAKTFTLDNSLIGTGKDKRVAVNSQYIVLSSQSATLEGVANVGTVAVFKNDPNLTFLRQINPDHSTGWDHFGCSMSIGEDGVAIGGLKTNAVTFVRF